MAMAMREEVSRDQKIFIAIETGSPEASIQRSGLVGQWQNATVAEAIEKSVLSHERWKTIDEKAYELEHDTVVELETLMQGNYRVIVNDSEIPYDNLSSIRLWSFIGNVDSSVYRFGVRIKVQPVDNSKKYQSKFETLREDLKEGVDALHLVGLFVGNLLAKKQMDARVLEFLPGKTVNDLLTKAHRMLQSKDYKGALEIYDLFIQIEPENADYKFLRGKALICLNQYEDGIMALKEAKVRGHEKAGIVISTLLSFRKKYGVYPLREQIELF